MKERPCSIWNGHCSGCEVGGSRINCTGPDYATGKHSVYIDDEGKQIPIDVIDAEMPLPDKITEETKEFQKKLPIRLNRG